MVALAITQAQRRLLVFAAAAFFVASIYLCTTRLFAMSFTREDIPSSYSSSTGSGSVGTGRLDVDIGDIDVGQIELSKADLPMSYGHFKRPAYDDIRLLGALPEEYVPTLRNRRRLIIFGDIHGMIEPFNALLEKAEYDETRDHVIAVGDMVNKGPNSAGVVARLMELKASAVRGNHEDRVLVAWAARSLQRGVESDLADTESEKHRGEHEDLSTARALSQEQRDWLSNLPVILTVDPLSLYVVHAGLVPGVELASQDPWAVMHMRTFSYPREEFRKKEEERKKKEAEKKKQEAEKKKKEAEKKKKEQEKKEEEGRKKKEEEEKAKQEEEMTKAEEERKKQEEEDRKTQEAAEAENPATRRRSESSAQASEADNALIIENALPDHDILLPVESHNGDPWTDLWNRAQQLLPSEHRRTVVFGHDAKRGYKETAYAIGLDSGCVSGNSLSALVIEAAEEGGFTHRTVQVPCKQG